SERKYVKLREQG
ncbi:hypothetical protein MTO96_046564, partial [Rhipicephalus appendiculatus]